MREIRARKLFTTPSASGVPARGAFVTSIDPAITVLHGVVGYDFVIIDREHGPNDILTTLNHVRAAEANGLVPLVRVLENSATMIQSTLDVGAHGVVVPKVSTAADARRAFEATQYRAGGHGSCSAVEGARWTDDWPSYMPDANENVIMIPLIETVAAIDNLEDIVRVDGVDAILIGFADLAQDMGLDQISARDQLIETWESCRKIAAASGVRIGGNYAPQYEPGDFVTLSADMKTLMHALADQLKLVDAPSAGRLQTPA